MNPKEMSLREILERLQKSSIDDIIGDNEIDQALSAIQAHYKSRLNKVVKHLEDLETEGDISINSGVTWKSIIEMHKE